jgi:ATP:ADP antiporter, AAA family
MPAPTFSRLTMFERLLSLFTSVRPGEGRSVFIMLTQVFLLMHGYYLIRLVRETLILVEGSPEVRSYSNGAIAITLIFVIPLYKLLFDYLKRGGDKSAVLRWVGSFFLSNLLILPSCSRSASRSPYPSSSGSVSTTSWSWPSSGPSQPTCSTSRRDNGCLP